MRPPQIALVVLIVFTCVLLLFYVTSGESFSSLSKSNLSASFNASLHADAVFPLILHQMWKSGSSPPSEALRWRNGCLNLNPFHDFRMYNDDDLRKFVERLYPEYFPLFQHLHGVYMADMARLLVIYHYGGIYLDMDFYCYRPFHCLERYARTKLAQKYNITDIMLVSKEPLMHAHLFREKSRVIIQDFFMSTPRHPFIKWMLDDRLKVFKTDPKSLLRGPFSYSIEKDIDRYYFEVGSCGVNEKCVSQTVIHPASCSNSSSTNSNSSVSSCSQNIAHFRRYLQNATYTIPSHSPALANTTTPENSLINDYSNSNINLLDNIPKKIGLIVELDPHITHPLVDSTNSRLYTRCKEKMKFNEQKESCDKVKKKQFFEPNEETILTHMWMHTYLGWTFVRGTYNYGSYYQVENTLRPVDSCPASLKI